MYAAAIFLSVRAPRRGRVGRWLLATAAICAVIASAWLRPMCSTIVRPDTGVYVASVGYVRLLIGVVLVALRRPRATTHRSVTAPRRPIAAAGHEWLAHA